MYAKLPDQSEHDIEMPSTHSPMFSDEFKVRILNRENAVEIQGLSSAMTIGQLKAKIALATNVASDDQRLIFSGKALRPDDATLSSFNIQNDSSIHLFPKPPQVTATPLATGTTPVASVNTTGIPDNLFANLTAMARQEYISHSSREVQLWSTVLIFLSAMTIMNNLSYVATNGSLGVSILDNIVNAFDTVS